MVSSIERFHCITTATTTAIAIATATATAIVTATATVTAILNLFNLFYMNYDK